MAVTIVWAGKVFNSAFNKEIDLDSDTIKGMLTSSAYTFDQDTHQYKSSVTNEVTGTNWAAGGVTLAGVAVAYNAGTNTFSFDANDISVANTTISNARKLVIYDNTPATDATRPIICVIDFGADVSTSNGTLAITFAAGGIATVTVS